MARYKSSITSQFEDIKFGLMHCVRIWLHERKPYNSKERPMPGKTLKDDWLKAHMDVFVKRRALEKLVKNPDTRAGDIMLAQGQYDDSKKEALEKYDEYLSRNDDKI